MRLVQAILISTIALSSVLVPHDSHASPKVEFLKIKENALPIETVLQICKTVADITFEETYSEYMKNRKRKPGEFTMAIQSDARIYSSSKRNTSLASCLLEQGYVVKQ